MERIASFCVDHTRLLPGMYLSRQDGADGEILTWDIRMKQPNKGSYLSPAAAHTLEHLFATYARNSKYSRGVVYVGPMGCLTGFYLLTTGLTPAEALDLTRSAFAWMAEYEGEIPGASAVECGNYLMMDPIAARAEAAPQFAAAVNEVLGRLEMGTAALVCTVEPLPRENWSAAGSASVVFEFKPGASMQPRPLARIASGGEISRVMLAIKVALGAKDGTETLVFDEVDAGVGGSTANALATVLAELAGSHQVIAITHLAQVAVLADAHYTVTKTAGDAPETILAPVTGDARVAEVARLLSGTATETSLAHARELLRQ